MNGILEQLDTLSIEDLNLVIAKAQELIEVKKQERERLEKERRRQEEIEELQRRLRELQGEETVQAAQSAPVQPEPAPIPTPPPTPEPTPTPHVYSMIPCPHCRQMLPSDSKFCYYCGKSTVADAPKPNVQPRQSGEYYESVRYMDESVKKWQTLDGEGEMVSWQSIVMSSPEEAKKLACYMKITTKRILISTESRLKAGARTTAFGAIGNLVVEEKGKPWVWIPLHVVRSYEILGKKEMRIEADRIYTFHASKAQDIYAALQQLIPNSAR